MMLLKLCAIPLASDPIICMRRARSSVVGVLLGRVRETRARGHWPPRRRQGAARARGRLVPCRPEGIEPQDASHPTRSDQRHAGPAADASGCEHVLHCAGRQSGSIRQSGDIGVGRGEPCGECQRLIGPARRISLSVRGPCMHSDGVLIQHYIGAFHANRAAEFAQHLFRPARRSPPAGN